MLCSCCVSARNDTIKPIKFNMNRDKYKETFIWQKSRDNHSYQLDITSKQTSN